MTTYKNPTALRKALSVLLALTMILALMPLLELTAKAANDISSSQTVDIKDLGEATTYNVSNNATLTVTSTGTLSGSFGITFDIDAGAKVIWANAMFTANVATPAVTLTGNGTFVMTDGSITSNQASSNALNVGSGVVAVLHGGGLSQVGTDYNVVEISGTAFRNSAISVTGTISTSGAGVSTIYDLTTASATPQEWSSAGISPDNISSAVWRIVSGESGIQYVQDGTTKFVAIPDDVTVTPVSLYFDGSVLKPGSTGTAIAKDTASPILGGGSYSWDDEDDTLTLNGVSFTTSAATALDLTNLPNTGATVVFEGDNSFVSTFSDKSSTYGIHLPNDGTVMLTGTGSVEAIGGTVSGSEYGIVNSSFGIYKSGDTVTISGDLTVEATGGTVSGGGSSYGISGSIVNISDNASVTATGVAASSDSIGISGSLTISGSASVTAQTTDSDGNTVQAFNGQLNLPSIYNYEAGDTSLGNTSVLVAYNNGTSFNNSGNPKYVKIGVDGTLKFVTDGTKLQYVLGEASVDVPTPAFEAPGLDYNYDPNGVGGETPLLTLNGISFTTRAETALDLSLLPDDATVQFTGTNKFVSTFSGENKDSYGILLGKDVPLGETPMTYTLTGTGSLTATGGTVNVTSNAAKASTGVYAVGNLDITGGTVTATGGETATSTAYEANSYGIIATNALTISGTANVTVTGGTSTGGIYATTQSYGAFAGRAITISGGTVTATGGTVAGGDSGASSRGLSAGGYITIDGGTVTATSGTVTATSGAATSGSSYGIYTEDAGGSLTINGGTVNATSDTASIYSVGILAYLGALEISGGTVTAQSGAAYQSGGIAAGTGALKISGGTVNATGGTATDISAGVATILNAAAITIEGSADVTARGGAVTLSSASGDVKSAGVYAAGAITISDSAEVEATGGTATNSDPSSGAGTNETYATSAGVYAGGALTIEDSVEVEAMGGAASNTSSNDNAKANSYGLYAYGPPQNTIAISGSANVTALGGTAEDSSIGAYADGDSGGASLNISGGTVTATGGAAKDSYGLMANSTITISGGTVEATGGTATSYSSGLKVNTGGGLIYIEGGTVEASGEDGAFLRESAAIAPDTLPAQYDWAYSTSANGASPITGDKTESSGTAYDYTAGGGSHRWVRISPYTPYTPPYAPPAPPTPPVQNIPAQDGEVQVPYTEQDGGASLQLPAEKTDEILAAATETGSDKADFDLSGNPDVTTATAPTTALETLVEAGLGLEFNFAGGSAALDPEAAADILAKAEGDTLEIKVEEIPEISQKELNSEQIGILAVGDTVYDVSVISNGVEIHEFAGTIKVTVPYTGKQPVKAWFMGDRGKSEKIDGVYDPVSKTFTFTVPHLSMWVVGQDTTWPFTDVAEDDSVNWFYSDVKFVWENGLMQGTSDTLFSPNTSMTRGMAVTILYRLEGQPATDANHTDFTDVSESAYYHDAVAWAAENEIVLGVGENLFAPERNITREQLAAILYRYAVYKGLGPVGEWSVYVPFEDYADTAEYALEAVMWCYIAGIINGKDGNLLDPTGNATRAEMAAITHRFVDNIAAK